MGFIIIKVTYPNKEEANKTISHLLKKSLIASANLFPIKSVSCWTGKITTGSEFMALLNTRKDNWEKVKTEIKKIHPYKVPCIAKIEADANKEYEEWVNKKTE
jgi:periplasmic divalent cation tolerance protein